MTLAAIPILDWNGPEFLLFYGVAFVVALIWSVMRRRRANDQFSLPGAEEVQLSDPYELAYLAGGAPRCSQVALVRLVEAGAIERKPSRLFSESKVVAIGSADAGFNDIERTVFSGILAYGEKGMPLSEIPQLVATRLSGIESRLAKLGLRPTASEKSGRGFSISLPLVFLLLLGIGKLVIGITRDKPVGLLVFFLVVTVVAAVIVAAGTKKLTPAGESLLKRMRDASQQNSRPQNEGMQTALCGVALLGVGGIGYNEHLVGLDAGLKKDLTQMGNPNNSSGCGSGCSSGCSSGCGGGCGGCGG
ncbi:TIGR04222 domain-containing membrane protein [Haloferula sp.]|uniref:TIGR04222 domain-containing membrane protein n=1 Tax=Haloferula sp. TaxID=2497595 RepID=UPI00329AA805